MRDEIGHLVIRDAGVDDTAAIGRVYVDTWRATYRGIVPDAVLERLSAERLARTFRREIENGQRVIVAVEGERVVGFSSGGRENNGDPLFRHEIYTLYVERDAQGRGIGKALVDAMCARLVDGAVIVWVLKRNRGARAFYLATGALPVRRSFAEMGGVRLPLVGYAWFDVDPPDDDLDDELDDDDTGGR